ncbi:hypothetical protein N5K35_14035 [Pseudomonas sp. GD03651]|uniref:hypothetical protein n=1 Tax=Pseudomonas sp. GD03651 TaxID=2975361 RepID=UPI00244D43E5|nr:hypothetical protein [Pseudomonas sp. GD03651]MDH2184828.1 hypothetical protein [Pseudomonas sp. GD03651]
MQSPDRITLVVRPADGHTLEEMKSYVRLEACVQLGNGLAVIAGASEGDLQWELEKALARAGGAPQMVAVYTPWTDVQVLDFLSVALRHVVVEGDLQFSDINDAMRYMAEKGQPAFCKAFGIDDHVKLVADARRYRWLRDRERIEDPDEDLLVVRGDNWLSGEELDQEIDTALRVQALQQQVVQEQLP